MRRTFVATASCLAIVASGCASIVSKSSWPVTVTSNPPGQAVTVRNEDGVLVQTGITPFTVTLPSSNGYFNGMDYTLESPAGTIPMESSLNGWYFGNIIFGGLIGILIVDPLTGAMWTLPSEVSVSGPATP